MNDRDARNLYLAHERYLREPDAEAMVERDHRRRGVWRAGMLADGRPCITAPNGVWYRCDSWSHAQALMMRINAVRDYAMDIMHDIESQPDTPQNGGDT